MAHDVLINAGIGETRVAVVSQGRLQDLIIERRGDPSESADARRAPCSLVGSVMLGRVQRVLPGMQAAFVDLGVERAGFLAVREARTQAGLAAHDDTVPSPCISRCVHEGESVVVQVIKDPIGDKGARLTTNVTLPGRLSVFVPRACEVTLSRRITDEADRARLLDTMARIMARPGMERCGFILRTAALRATPEELAADADALIDLWKSICARARMAVRPGVLHREIDAVQRCLRDIVDEQTDRILVDCPLALGAARAYAERTIPEVREKISGFKGPGPLFELHGVEGQIEELLRPRAALPSGGWITIETTEALTAVDVNSGSFTGGSCLAETSARTNIEAANEIGRQLRLRGIGGVVVVDFIHMADPASVQSVLTALEASLMADRVPTQMSGMSPFGLVEITRKRVREPLSKLLTEPCKPCHGEGRIPTVATVANMILRRMQVEARANPGRRLSVRAAPDVVLWVNSLGEDVHRVIRLRLGAEAEWIADGARCREAFDVQAAG